MHARFPDRTRRRTMQDCVCGARVRAPRYPRPGVAEAIVFRMARPPHGRINEVLMRPTDQERWAPVRHEEVVR